MKRRMRIGLLFGGSSVEHEVSVVSARSIAAGFDEAKYEIVPIGVTPGGRWLPPVPSLAILAGGRARVELDPGEDDGANLVADPGGGGLYRVVSGREPEPLDLDAAFPIIHGWGGEDGRIQGLLELSGVPYVGAGVAGSAVAMDKAAARTLLAYHGVPLAAWTSVLRHEYDSDRDAALRALGSDPGFPMFVKPANGGSSVGIRKVSTPEALPEALATAFGLDRKVVVERAVDAREVECAVLGNDTPEASIAGEIVPGAEFYTYEDKYIDDAAELRIPAPVSPGTADTVRSLAIRAFRLLDLSGMARVDFLVDRASEEVYFNEANTLPGFTPISMYSKLWEASGLAYPDLLARLVDLALERAEAERLRATHWNV